MSDLDSLLDRKTRRVRELQTEVERLRYVARLIVEYEPATQGPTLLYIQEQAAKALAGQENP